MFISKNSLECRMKELHDAIEVLRKHKELSEICFKVYLSYEDTYPYRYDLEKEAIIHGYNIYFKAGDAGTTLGMLEDVTSRYWE